MWFKMWYLGMSSDAVHEARELLIGHGATEKIAKSSEKSKKVKKEVDGSRQFGQISWK